MSSETPIQTGSIHNAIMLLPEPLRGDIAARMAPGETILAKAESELAATGEFGHSCLVVTDRRVFSLANGGGRSAVSCDLNLTEVLELRKHDLRGLYRLDLLTKSSAHTVALFPKTIHGEFEAAIAAIHARTARKGDPAESAAEGNAVPWSGGDEGSRNFAARPPEICPTCKKPVPHRLGVCPDCLDKRRVLTRLMGRAKPYWLPLTATFVLMLLITAVEMMQPVLTKLMVDRVIPNADLALFAWIVGGIVLIHLFSSVFAGARSYLMSQLGEQVTHDLRTEMYDHLQVLSLDYYDKHQTGWVMDRVSADTGNVQDFLTEGFQDFLRDAMTIVVIIAIMLAMDWKLALITLIPAPLVAVITYRFVRRAHRLYMRVWRKRSRMSALLANVIPGIRVVKAFAQETSERERFTESSRDFMECNVVVSRAFSVFQPVTNFITSLGSVAVWGFGGYLVVTGKGVTLGTLIAFISYLWRFYGPLNNLSRFSRRLQRAVTAAQRVFDVLDAQPSVADRETATVMPRIVGEVSFRGVTFGYAQGEPVLRDVNFTAKSGEMIGLVGPSGAGKSTTINLLCRFYDVEEGSITIDGVEIRTVSLESLRRQIGVVLQEPFLFHGSVGQNIAYGKPGASREEIIRAAKAANAHEFIMRLPESYDTLVGERGQRLSGGERQRISIARAILKDPKILILDEATSSVDTETEAAIQEAIERLVQGRTTFAIAHRFSTLRHADRLVVLDEGKVAEVGTHEELLSNKDGVFRRLCDIQAKTSQIVAVGG